ncbi:DUF397 domain-containing protein [Actinomadura sp. 9N407]|uniref:DUF397 domain-containing protein n=1 Tax=Actinomadura sp. 9N407 TaxID=3375154 RepID=UPI0037A32CC2
MNDPRPAEHAWRKSKRSGGQGSACVEVAPVGRTVTLRDSKDPHGPYVYLAGPAWSALIGQIRAGALDIQGP